MRSFGTAVKQGRLKPGVEKTVFEYTLSSSATHGAITAQWHAGKSSGVTPSFRIRVYIDGEDTASVDYPLFLAHGTGPAQTSLRDLTNGELLPPWSSALFGRTHDSGWWNTYLIPFGKSIRVTLTDPENDSPFWYMVKGYENAPLVVSGLALPPSTRLQLIRTTDPSVRAGSLVTFANVSLGSDSGSSSGGLIRQLNLVVNSSQYHYQEGCVSALIDAGTETENGLWISSGLEDVFLGAYFHSMPTMHTPYAGFQLNATQWNQGDIASNSLAAYRIFEHDPILFSESVKFRWIASSDNGGKNEGFCNYEWPQAKVPADAPPVDPKAETISVDALTWVYTWTN